jgi:hypothetical protein
MSQCGKTARRPRRDRSEYHREYYRRNRERLLAYQREYTKMHRGKPSRSETGPIDEPLPECDAYNLRDFMRACPEKAARMIDRVIAGDRKLML